MADPTGFLTTQRQIAAKRPVDVRIADWREVQAGMRPADTERQAGRCMDCGIPFCHNGCPLGNLIPEWNDLVWRQHWQEAVARLHLTPVRYPHVNGPPGGDLPLRGQKSGRIRHLTSLSKATLTFHSPRALATRRRHHGFGDVMTVAPGPAGGRKSPLVVPGHHPAQPLQCGRPVGDEICRDR